MSQAPASVKPLAARVVVVDDEENMGKILAKILSMEGYHVTPFTRPEEAIAHVQKSPPDLVLTDMKMPGMTGIEVLKAVKQASPTTNVIMMTAFGTVETTVEAMKNGAFDYVLKPFKTDELLITIARALENVRLVAENESLNETIRRTAPETEIVGSSPAIQETIRMLDRIAPTDSAVLIRGESGTGKELVARAIHNQSPRSHKRFVAINCASIPEALLESELFGHEKGSFTGADRTKLGLVELAHGGTLFLDEIGDLPLALQAKLLRVLQEREIQRVGGLQTIPVDIRLVAATNCDLKSAIERKEFRADLFYRLDVISIHLPALRERRGDIPILIEFFIEKISRRMRKSKLTISPEAVAALDAYDFPGNIRELENVIERIIVLCASDQIELDDIPADIRMCPTGRVRGDASGRGSGSGASIEYKDAKDAFEKDYLQTIIAKAKGNITEASRMAGLSRRHFYEKLEKLGIKTER